MLGQTHPEFGWGQTPIFAAYALARLTLPAKRATGFYVLATQMLPPVGLVIPYFLMLRQVGWLDTYHGMVLVYTSAALPFAIWLMMSYFEEIPREMEEPRSSTAPGACARSST